MSGSRKGAKSPRNAMSVLLSSGLLNGLSSSINHDKSAVVSEGKEKKTKAIYSGYLLKLSGKTVLSGGNWKRKFFVLEKKRLAYYESEEVWNAGSRASGFISLEFYDLCEEKETRKATNVFFVGSSDKNLFENTRHYFSAETLPEMTAWMSHIRSALKDVRKSQRGSVSHRQNADLEVQVQRIDEKRRNDGRESPSNKKKERKQKMEETKGHETEETLQPLTKARVRGPTGRKLPTNHRATLLGGDSRSKSSSLTTLDASSKEDARRSFYLMSRSVDLSDEEDTYESLQVPDKRLTLYEYSSDDNSISESSKLDSSVTSAAALTAKKEAQRGRQPRQSFGSTPSLILECDEVKAVTTRNYNTAPTPARKARRAKERQTPLNDARVTDTLNDLERLWEDDGPPQTNQLPSGSSKLMNVLHYLYSQTTELRKTLLALEEDSADARRDMGALQENLMVVRTATNTTSDRISKLQSTLNVVEKQIGLAAKEGHMLEQRAIRALEAAETAEKEFTRLRNECQSLILQIKSRRNSERDKREDSPVFDTLPDTPSGSLKESFILSSSPSFIPDKSTKKSNTDTLPPTTFKFEPPKVFDFGINGFTPFNPSELKFFAKNPSLSSAATSTPRVQSPVPGKSAMKQDKESPANKSVTFEDEGPGEAEEN